MNKETALLIAALCFLLSTLILLFQNAKLYQQVRSLRHLHPDIIGQMRWLMMRLKTLKKSNEKYIKYLASQNGMRNRNARYCTRGYVMGLHYAIRELENILKDHLAEEDNE